MNVNLMLSVYEFQLVLQLLQQERDELRPEIHHTDSPTAHDDLKKRLAMVDELLARLRTQKPS